MSLTSTFSVAVDLPATASVAAAIMAAVLISLVIVRFFAPQFQPEKFSFSEPFLSLFLR